MSHDDIPAYGLWSLVVINTAVFVIFAFSFTHPRTARDWRSFGAFSAFLFALFTEMYGFPLTIYLLSGWLGSRYPGVNLWSHDAGHLWHTLLGWHGNPHADPLHILSNLLIGAGGGENECPRAGNGPLVTAPLEGRDIKRGAVPVKADWGTLGRTVLVDRGQNRVAPLCEESIELL